MAKIIFGYKRPASFFRPEIELMFAFYIFDNGDVTIKKFSYEKNVIKTKKIIVPLSVVEDIKKYLIGQKNLIDKLPEEINSFTVCGGRDYFNFLGKKFCCWNPEKIVGERRKNFDFFLGKLSPEGEEIIHQHNYIFETIYSFLKDYGLKVYSWRSFSCNWEME